VDGRGRWPRLSQQLTVEQCLALRAGAVARMISCKISQARLTWEADRHHQASVEATVAVEASGLPKFRLSYVVGPTSDRRRVAQVVEMCQTAQWRGSRLWFLCPTCSRRCGVLYFRPGGHAFRCRICGRLIYRCQRNGARRLGSKPPSSPEAVGRAQGKMQKSLADVISAAQLGRLPGDQQSGRSASAEPTQCPGHALARKGGAHEIQCKQECSSRLD